MRGAKLACTLLFLLSVLTIFSESKAQGVFEGTIQNYDKSAASVAAGMMVPFEIGKVDEDGSFSIPLNDDFITNMKNSVEQDNENADGWSTQLLTTGRVFRCSNGDVEITNEDLPIINLSSNGSYSIADIEQETFYGYFMATSSGDFTQAFNSFGQMDAALGYYLDWFYFEEPVSVTGSCEVETYAKNQEDMYVMRTSYDMDFEAGWNLVKYEVTDIYEDPDGTNTPLATGYSTIDSIPEEVIYYFFE